MKQLLAFLQKMFAKSPAPLPRETTDHVDRRILAVILPTTACAIGTAALLTLLYFPEKILLNFSTYILFTLFLIPLMFMQKQFPRKTLNLVVVSILAYNAVYLVLNGGNFLTPSALLLPSIAVTLTAWTRGNRAAFAIVFLVGFAYAVDAVLIEAGIIPAPSILDHLFGRAAFSFVLLLFQLAAVTIPAKMFATTLEESRTSRDRLEKALSDLYESRSFTMQAVDNSRELFGWLLPDGTLQFVNNVALTMIGSDKATILGRKFWDTPWFTEKDEQLRLQDAIESAARGDVVRYETWHRDQTGSIHTIDFSLNPVYDASGTVSIIVAEGHDITIVRDEMRKREELAEQLNQSRKIEAIGQLAGGVAHDFNNALAGIIGAAELAKFSDVTPEKRMQFLDMIVSAADRAGELTRKLLAFARKGHTSNASLNILTVLNDTVAILRHTIDPRIEITVSSRTSATTITGDDALLQNAFMNLAINAVHAMPNGGRLDFVIDRHSVDKQEHETLHAFAVEQKEYVRISVSDTGTGIDPAIISRIFEPFFTTKDRSHGTGLGLASVYGTVQDHHGAITVESQQGAGTTFRILLPPGTETTQATAETSDVEIHCTGTILFVDDEELIRQTVAQQLKRLGYTVLTAANGQEALTHFHANRAEIKLVILDMIMPIMNGRDTAYRLREIDQNLPIVISSGFAKQEDIQALDELDIAEFLQKPFRMQELRETVERVLGE